MLKQDSVGTQVTTRFSSLLPKGTRATIRDCKFVGNTTIRVYLIESAIGELVWYLDRDLKNIKQSKEKEYR